MKRSLFVNAAAAKLSLITALFVMSLSGCQKDLYDPSVGGDEKVTLDNYFDFATTKSVQLNVDYGTDCPKAYFEVYAENPLEVKEGQVVKRTDLIPVASGFTDANGVYNKKASITASVSKVYVYSPDFGVPTLFETEVADKNIKATISFESAINLSSMVDAQMVTSRASQSTIKQHIPNFLSGFDSKGKPNNIDSKLKVNVDNTLKSYITTYFGDGNHSDSPYITDDADITIYKDAHVVINYFGGSTGAQSVFAYYCYPMDASQEVITQAAKNACVIFPRAHADALGDYSGVGVQLQYIDASGRLSGTEFPKNTRIGFLIWNNGWTNGNGGRFENNVFYSTKSLNNDQKSHTAVFGGEDNKGQKYNIITMEDWNDWDYNDLAFIISTDPIDAIDVPEAPKPGDRVGTEAYRGLLGFEDNWPNQGDYDMNDMVLKYVSSVDYNFENNVISITDKFTLSWTGANYRNGFAYEVPFDLSNADVSVSGGASSSVSGNVITLFSDARSELGLSDVPPADMPGMDVKGKVYTVSIKFDKPSIDKQNVVPPYNPFIRVNNSNTEVHLTNYKPSPKATNTFPNGADISTGNGNYFICEDGFPFAIHMDARVDESIMNLNLKAEKTRIDESYPNFKEWAKTRDPKTKWW